MLQLDHIAVGCTRLAEGQEWVQDTLGVTLQPGGQHARYGTHNMLLGLADGLYLEVIALDPDAAPTGRPAWFALDHFTGPPRLANWICRTDDLTVAMLSAPDNVGRIVDLERGDLCWQITVPDDGSLPYDGAFPTLIRWDPKTIHPATQLSDSKCRLTGWEVAHPQADMLRDMMMLRDMPVRFSTGPTRFRATFETPHGYRTLD